MKGKKFRFTKKKGIILAASVVAVGCIIYAATISSRAKNVHIGVSCSALQKTVLQDTVSVSGIVHSQNSYNVYTTQSFPVEKVSVSVGDKVKKGDILAVLDTSSLERDLKIQQYTTQSASQGASISLQQAKDNYENALYLYNHDMDAGVVSAKSQLDTAKSALQTEKDTYAYDKYKFDNGQLSKLDLNQEEQKLSQAQSAYDNAVKSYSAAQSKAQLDLKTAKGTYEDAVAKNGDKTQQATLEKLQQSLNDCIITAPSDGTVTVSNATVGSTPAGVLFKIEDTGSLMVDAEVREIDTGNLKVGDKATITTDVTGSDKMTGAVTNVAPAATQSVAQTAAGVTTTTDNTGSVTFAAKIAITGSKPAVKIGMKAKASIVLEEKDDVFVVPYDSLLQKAGGSYSIMVADKTGALYKVKELPVKTGMETDVSVEISGSGLKEGMLIIENPESVQPGDTVQPSSSSGSDSNMGEG